MRQARIASLATYVPPRVLSNADLEEMVETSNEWILKRTGIRERHLVDPGVATSDLAKEAALSAIAQAGLTPADIGFIVVATTTPDMFFPSTACLLQTKIGATNAWGFDLGAACSGFTYALTTAAQMVITGAHDHALVIGADVMSSIIDYTDRATCILFGDGAGAVVLSPAIDDGLGIVDFAHEVDGSGGPALCMPAGGSLRPASHETVDERLHYVHQDGATVFKFAVRKTEEICGKVLAQNGIGADDVDLFVSHQANRRIIENAAERLGLDRSKDRDQHRAFRQYDGRHDSSRAHRCCGRRPPEEGRPRVADDRWGRLHGGCRLAPVGVLSLVDARFRLRLRPSR